MNAHLTEKLVHATGLAWVDYKRRHPALARAIESEVGTPVDIVVKALQTDEAYHDLVAQTEAETDVANLVKLVAPVVLDIIFGFVRA